MNRRKASEDSSEAGQFNPLLSHDLRAALADVVGGLQLMDITKLSGANKAQMERILASSEALVSLMDTLTEGLQQGALGSATSLNIVDLEVFLHRTRRRWVGVAEQKAIAFELIRAERLPRYVTLPGASLERVLGNILENSFKYTTQGLVRLSVEVTQSEELLFRVADTGPGFSEEAAETMFKFGARPQKTTLPGNGLGLYGAKMLLEQMGGKIIVENSADGAAVTAQFPSRTWRLSRTGSKRFAEQNGGSQSLTGLHFLLAEDNKTSQLVAVNMLRRLGAKVTSVENGKQALDQIDRGNFDVVLLDIEMPEMTGIEVIEKVRARSGQIATIPMIALTAFVLEEDRERIMTAGADGSISKPVTDAGEFGRTINRILNGLTRFTEGREAAGARHGVQLFIDREVFFGLKESVGEEAFFLILEKMEMDLSEVRKELVEASRNKDFAGLRKASHVLISLSGAVGANRLLSDAQSLNVYANDQNIGHAEAKCDACTEDIARLIAFVSEQRKFI